MTWINNGPVLGLLLFYQNKKCFWFSSPLDMQRDGRVSFWREKELSEGPAAEEVENTCISLEISQLFYGEGDLSYGTCA